MYKSSRVFIYGGVGGVLLLLVAGMSLFAFSVDDVSAQPTRNTREPRATREAPVSTPEPRATRDTVVFTEIAATTDAIRTAVGQNAQSGAMTATAIATEIQGLVEEVAAQIEILTGYFSLNGSVNYDPEAGELMLTVVVDEAQVNTAIEAAFTMAGVENDFAVDFDGATSTIIVTVEDVELSNGRTATVALSFQPMIMDDGVTLVLVSASLNGVSIPVDSVDEVIVQLVSAALDSVSIDLPDIVQDTDYEGEFPYSVDLIVITDDTMTIVITVYIPTELP